MLKTHHKETTMDSSEKFPPPDSLDCHSEKSLSKSSEPILHPKRMGSHIGVGFWHLFKTHWHQVLTYCAVFADFGMCVAFLGPTILDLGCLTATDMQTMSWVFFSQLLCSLIGASMAGYLVQR